MYTFHTEFFKGPLFDSATVTMTHAGNDVGKKVFGYNETELIDDWIIAKVTDLELSPDDYVITDNRTR